MQFAEGKMARFESKKINELRARCQPAFKAYQDPLSEWHLIRPFSIYFTWLFSTLGISANAVTFMGLVVGVCGGAFLSSSNASLVFWGASLVMMSYVFDCVDGELARYYGVSSLRGTYIDACAGDLNDFAIFMGLAFFAQTAFPDTLSMAPIVTAAIVYTRVMFRTNFWSTIGLSLSRTPSPSLEEASAEAQELSQVRRTLGARILRLPTETFFFAVLIFFSSILFFLFDFKLPLMLTWIAYLGSFLFASVYLFYKQVYLNDFDEKANTLKFNILKNSRRGH